jgi:ornithine--oxo-acid transaminase
MLNKFIKKELLYGANNYKPLNVIIKQGKGIYLTDINNKKYMDFLSGYSAVNQGHCHLKIIDVLKKQSQTLTLTSRAFYNNKLGELCEYLCNTFNYEKFIPMNTGVEAGETAIKIARKWGYENKNITPNKAVNLFCNNNFWGRTIAALSSSSDNTCYNNFGPYTNGFELIEYNNLEILEKKLINNPNIVSFMLEPIQGEGGIIIPNKDYIKNVYKLCKKYNVLMIFDEVQTGLGRTGKLLACDYDNIRPDMLILGKSLSGGVYPISGVLTRSEIMDILTPGTHGSTYGGNPLACAISMEAVNIIFEEDLINNSYKMGKYFRDELNKLKLKNVTDIRGKGLLNAIEFNNKRNATRGLKNLKNNGLLTNITKNKILRLTPPLIINKNQINNALEIIESSLNYD